jgi:alkanesulfonate monooxygenase SsuD/methylene tetrahydromethanopterin reductase-like flavin-dependent oxidoreductase (luciferase family)
MDIGIGLPAAIPWVRPPTIRDWAREAEDAGFSTLGTIDRVVYGNYEPIPTLGAVAAVTERIRLTTAILITPLRGNGVLLAKQLATIDQLSGGRLTVGIAVGGREDDYTAAGVDFHTRGHLHDRQLDEMWAVWAGEPRGVARPVGPSPAQHGGPPLLMGGTSDAVVRRTVEYGAGWIAGGGGPDMFTPMASKVRAAWKEAGREGDPHLAALAYFSLGKQGTKEAKRYLLDYYAFAPAYAEAIAAGALTTSGEVRKAMAAFTAVGCDELILFPCSPDLDQVALLADAALAD